MLIEKIGVFIIVLVALVVVVVAFFLLQEQDEPALIIDVTDNNQPEQQSSQIKEFTIRESNFKLIPSNIQVSRGDTVRITVINDDGTHTLFVKGYSERTDIVSSGNTRVLEFVADKAGTFNSWCEVGSHRSLGMEGTLIVQ